MHPSFLQAGLFSAVRSAFIIQIQSELRQDPNDITQDLLRLLIHNSNRTPSDLVFAQGLLYISLCCTLLAAPFAVLGKQWLMHYGGNRDPGVLKPWGLQRQRKVDGRNKWRFVAALQAAPYLLRMGLGIFGLALSIYLWTIRQSSSAIIVTMFSVGGIISYIAYVGSAILDSDSPYQAPLGVALAFLCKRHIKKISAVFTPIHQFVTQSLPLFLKLKSDTKDGNTPLFSGSPPPPSPAVPAVLWVLETSTNPD
ncbi:hypothetical protein C8J57DRAFT_1495179 [Mycena rebaudengoi]|nr:hypothetical protein C8J57DRAFT_1495179 [Mycena rebaudengoi]